MTKKHAFEPKIVAFLCNWCSYTAADLAGTARRKYPFNARIIRVMCTGRLDPAFVLKAFAEGADGVLISGCHPQECHYISGNYKAYKRSMAIKNLIADLGIEPERFTMTFASASEGEKFAGIVRELTETVRALGPMGRVSDRLARYSQFKQDDIVAGGEDLG